MLLLLLLIWRRSTTILKVSSTTATSVVKVSSSSGTSGRTAIVVIWSIVVVVVVVIHSHPSSVHMTTTSIIISAATTGRRRNKSGTDPRSFSCFFVIIKRNSGTLVGIFLPSIRQRWNHWIFFSSDADESLLCRCQPHSTLLPFDNVFLVMQLEILTEFPSSALLFPTGSTVVR